MAPHREGGHGGLSYLSKNVAKTSIGASPGSLDRFHYLSEAMTPGMPPLTLTLSDVENLGPQI